MTRKARVVSLESAERQPEKSERRSIRLKSGRKLVVHSGEKEDLLEILAPAGEISIKIHLTESGPLISVKGARLELNSAESITLNARRVEINAKEEALLTSEGTLKIESAEKMGIRCEDDLRVAGKLIYLN